MGKDEIVVIIEAHSNYGTCKDKMRSGYKSNCDKGYHGTDCETQQATEYGYVLPTACGVTRTRYGRRWLDLYY